MPNKQKPKEPLLALFLTFIFQGIGQLYAGKLRKGLIIVVISLIQIVATIMIVRDLVFNPESKITPLHFLAVALAGGFNVFVMIDAYLSARSFNESNQIECRQTAKKWIFFIVGYIVFSSLTRIFDPGSFIKKNYVESFKIASKSMSPTLIRGDKLFVDKSIYKQSEPKRGDVIAVKYPEYPRKVFIGRLVAFEGESVEIKDDKVFVDGKALDDAETFGRFSYSNWGNYGKSGKPVIVPPKSYYVLADHNEASSDSRLYGFIPKKNLVGKAIKIWWPSRRTSAIA